MKEDARSFQQILKEAISLEEQQIPHAKPTLLHSSQQLNQLPKMNFVLWSSLTAPSVSVRLARKYPMAKVAERPNLPLTNTVAAPVPKPTERQFAVSDFSPECSLIIYQWVKWGSLHQSDRYTWSELKRAYRRLALQYHPDRWPDSKEANQKFIECKQGFDQIQKDYQSIKAKAA